MRYYLDNTEEIIPVSASPSGFVCAPHCTGDNEERADDSSECKCIDNYEYGIMDYKNCYKICDSHLTRDSTDESC